MGGGGSRFIVPGYLGTGIIVLDPLWLGSQNWGVGWSERVKFVGRTVRFGRLVVQCHDSQKGSVSGQYDLVKSWRRTLKLCKIFWKNDKINFGKIRV